MPIRGIRRYRFACRHAFVRETIQSDTVAARRVRVPGADVDVAAMHRAHIVDVEIGMIAPRVGSGLGPMSSTVGRTIERTLAGFDGEVSHAAVAERARRMHGAGAQGLSP